MNIPLALVDINEGTMSVFARNTDILMLIGIGGVIIIAMYILVDKMICNKVTMLEASQSGLKASLDGLMKKMDNLTELLTALQISQAHITASLINRADIEEKVNNVLACHERDCPARRYIIPNRD